MDNVTDSPAFFPLCSQKPAAQYETSWTWSGGEQESHKTFIMYSVRGKISDSESNGKNSDGTDQNFSDEISDSEIGYLMGDNDSQ